MAWFIVFLILGSIFTLLGAVFVLAKIADNGKCGAGVFATILGIILLIVAVYFFDPLGRPNAIPAIEVAWVQVVPGDEACAPILGDLKPKSIPAIGGCRPKFSARAVVNAVGCPTIDLTGPTGVITRIRMEKRQGYRDKGLRGVIVCAAPADSDTSEIKFSEELSISVTKFWSNGRPKKIVLFGDSGCRKGQDCDKKWPFAAVAKAAEEQKPGLVVHLGDYAYQGADDWDTWKRYFFKPAKLLLESAPWIFVRGNHERCSSKEDQYPLGYYLLFDDGPATPCNTAVQLAKPYLATPYAVDLSTRFRLIVADTSAAWAEEPATVMSHKCDSKHVNPGDAKVCAAIMDVLTGVKNLANPPIGKGHSRKPTVWLAAHVPVFGFEFDNESKTDRIPKPSAMMLGAWKGAGVTGVDLIVSGDRHLYQVVKTENEPLQISAGTGGVKLDPVPYANGSVALVAKFVTLKSALTTNQNNYGAGDTISRDLVAGKTLNFLQEGCSYEGFGFLMVEWKNGFSRPTFNPVPGISGQDLCR